MQTIESDVVVIGAGLTGALIARKLAEAGQQVVILEATRAPGGTSVWGHGLALLGTPELYTTLEERYGAEMATRIWQLTRENLEYLVATADKLGIPTTQVGSYRLTNDSQAAQHLQLTAQQLTKLNIGATLEDATDDGFLVGLQLPEGIAFSPQALITALLEHPNINLQLDTEVQQIKQRDNRLAIWAYKHYNLAKAIVLTGGAYALQLNPLLSEIISPLPVQMVKCDARPTLDKPVILEDGHVVAYEQAGAWQMVSWAKTSEQGWQYLTQATEQLCPHATVLERRSGWVTYSKDSLPVVGEIPDIPGFYIISGLGPWGTNWAFVAVEQLIDLLLKDKDTGLLNISRFVYIQ